MSLRGSRKGWNSRNDKTSGDRIRISGKIIDTGNNRWTCRVCRGNVQDGNSEIWSLPKVAKNGGHVRAVDFGNLRDRSSTTTEIKIKRGCFRAKRRKGSAQKEKSEVIGR